MGTQRDCAAHHVVVPLLALLPTCGGRGLLVARTLVSCAVDEPSTGRWPDGEDSNYGLVSLADDAYTILSQKMTQVHAEASQWHSAGVVTSKA